MPIPGARMTPRLKAFDREGRKEKSAKAAKKVYKRVPAAG
jgi:hypothetical protein